MRSIPTRRSRRRNRLSVWAAASALVAITTVARGAEPEHGFEESLEVEAAQPSRDDSAAFATELNGEEAVARGEELQDLLRQVPSARLSSFGGIGRYAVVSQRGSTAEQVTISVDGVPQNRALGGAVDLSFLPTADLGTVTAWRGFAPAASGVFGMGGWIDIRTRPASQRDEWRAVLLAGELGTRRAVVAASWKLPRGALRFSADRLRSEGRFSYLDTNGTLLSQRDDRIRVREHNGVTTTMLALDGGWDRAAGGRLALRVGWRDREQEIPGFDGFRARAATFDERSTDLSATWTRGVFDLIADLSAGNQRLDDRGGELGAGLRDNLTRSNIEGFAALWRLASGRWRNMLRVDLRREQVALENRALSAPFRDRGGAERRRLQLAFEPALTWGMAVICPSLSVARRDDRFEPGAHVPAIGSDLHATESAAKLGVALALPRNWQWRSSLGRFYRAPSLGELFVDTGLSVANPKLEPEHGLQLESGIAHEESRRAIELVGFVTRAGDLIQYITNAQGAAVAVNLGAAAIRGVEFSGRYSLGRSWSLSASLSREWSESRSSFTRGRPLPGHPDWSGSTAIKYRSGAWGVEHQLAYVGRNSSDPFDREELRLPARVLHDLRFSKVSGATTWRLSIDNIFDRTTRDLTRFPLPGRVISLSLSWSNRGSG